MRKAILVLIILITALTDTYAQKTKPTVDELKKLGKDSLIKMAIIKMNDSTFHPEYYDVIEVKANKTSLEVDFSLSVRFHNGKNCFYEHVTVGLLNSNTDKSASGDCDQLSYFRPTEKLKKKIDFVFDAINKSEDLGHFNGNKLPAGTKMDITEHGSYYYVEVSDDVTYSHYKVDRSSGKISEIGSKEYARSPIDNDGWEIIH